MQRKASSRDVAELAGVSRTTVSYVLNEREGAAIPEETRARVLAAAQELKYRSNRLANGILRGRTRLLGVVLPHLTHSYYAAIAQGIHEECDHHGYCVLLTHSRSDLLVEGERVGMLMEYRVDGLICVSWQRQVENVVPWVDEARERGLPCVVLDNVPDESTLDGVVCDDFAGARAATEHLISLGHQRIGHLKGADATSTGPLRYRGYLEALRAAGLPIDEQLVAGNSYEIEAGAQAMRELLALPQPPTAVFASNDHLAIGALEAIAERGLRAPEDIALVGFGNLKEARGLGISSVDQNPLEIGRRAVQRVLARLEDGTRPTEKIIVPTQLVVRRSCGAPESLRTVSPHIDW
jgi:LacI family transcriptional regulator